MKYTAKRLLALLLSLLLSLSLLPVSAVADEGTIQTAEEGTIRATANGMIAASEAVAKADNTDPADKTDTDNSGKTLHEIYINPLYADVIPEDELLDPENDVRRRASRTIYTSVEEAGAYVRQCMENREEVISLSVSNDIEFSKQSFHDIMDAAMVNTGIPTEGDYIRFQYGQWGASGWGSSDGWGIQYTVVYYTTAAQEQEMEQAVENLLDDLQLDGKTEYDTIRGIYDYITENITYDYDNLNIDSYKLKYTAYAALINKTAVCQGYSVLLYRLLLERGIDCRVISGIGNGGAHAWNIVRIGNLYYDADSTWDAGRYRYDYFLRCDAKFTGHVRGNEYGTSSFYEAYPMSEKDYDPDEIAKLVDVEWIWEDDYSSATAIFYDKAGTYLDTVTGVITEKIREAGCEEAGSISYMAYAVYQEASFTDTKSVTIPAIGHTPGETVFDNEVEPTCTEEGSFDEVICCTTCGKELSRETRTTEKLPHTPGEPVREHEIPATTTADGSYEEVIYCMVCEEELSRETKTIPMLTYRLSETDLLLVAGKTGALKVTDDEGKTVRAVWSTSNDEIAAVNEGVVTARKAGKAVITATVGDFSAECEIFVQFTDVTDSSRSFYEPVYWALENGITTGTSKTTFSPDKSCTRAQIVTFLWRLKDCPEPSSMESPFTDVTNPKASYYKAVLWALENGITTGMSKTTFSPDKACTRAQCVTFLWRALGEPEPSTEKSPFTDVTNPKASYYKAVLWALENGITTGTSKTTFSPDKPCTRGQIVTFLYRYNNLGTAAG